MRFAADDTKAAAMRATDRERRPGAAPVVTAPTHSGLSFRVMPKPTLAKVRETCQYYERKGGPTHMGGGGKAIRARLLFDLSRDVQALVVALEAEEDGRSDLEVRARRLVSAHPNPSPRFDFASET